MSKRYRCEGNILEKVALNPRTILKVSRRDLFKRALVQSERSDRFQPEQILNIIENVSH